MLSSYRLGLQYFFPGCRPFCAPRVMKFRVLAAWEDVTSRQGKRRGARVVFGAAILLTALFCSMLGTGPCNCEITGEQGCSYGGNSLELHSEGIPVESGVLFSRILSRGWLVYPHECGTNTFKCPIVSCQIIYTLLTANFLLYSTQPLWLAVSAARSSCGGYVFVSVLRSTINLMDVCLCFLVF